MATYQYGAQKPNKPSKGKSSRETEIVFSILRGLMLLVLLPFRNKKAPTAKTRQAHALDTQEVAKRWSDIQTSIGLGGITHFGSAIVAADKLLDYVLRQKGYSGDTMGERLRSAQDDLPGDIYHKAWQAHKLRNQLVHEVDSEVLGHQAKEAIMQYEQVLRYLGALR